VSSQQDRESFWSSPATPLPSHVAPEGDARPRRSAPPMLWMVVLAVIGALIGASVVAVAARRTNSALGDELASARAATADLQTANEDLSAEISELQDEVAMLEDEVIPSDELREREAALDRRDQSLDERTTDLNQRARQLDSREAALDERAAAISTQERAIEESTFGGDGIYVVGSDIAPGTYRSNGGGSCYWARLRNLGGGLDSIIANHIGGGPQTVTISPTDAGFETSGCGEWSPV
jgi:hypothetical protein